MKPYEKFISREDVLQIHEATLRIFKESGIAFENDKIIEICKKNGLKTEGYKVFFDEKTVEKARQTFPKKFELRLTADENVILGEHAMLRLPIGHPAFYCDENGVIKKMNSDLAIRQFKMNEACNATNSSLVNQAIMFDTNPTEEQMIFGAAAFRYKYSNKYHISAGEYCSGLQPEEAYHRSLQGLELLKRFKGIESGIYAQSGINSLSPLTFDEMPLYRLLAAVENGIPMAVIPCAMPLLTAPASLAGLLAQTNAETLAGMILTQLINPGNPVIYCNVSGGTDMRTLQLCIGSPETALIGYATAAMADFYDVPFRMGGVMGDAKQVDAQAGAESFMMLYATYDCKPDIALHHVGCMGAMNVYSCEKFILDEEVANYVERMLRGIDINEKKLAVEEIVKAGPRGSHIKGRTPKDYREDFYLAQLFNKDDPNNWQNSGGKTIVEVAHEEVERRLKAYTPPVLSKEQEEIIMSYLPEKLKYGI